MCLFGMAVVEGWDGRSGKEITDAALTHALNVMQDVMDVQAPAPAVVPVNDGGLQLEWQYPMLQIEIYIDSHGGATAWVAEDGREEDYNYYAAVRLSFALQSLRRSLA